MNIKFIEIQNFRKLKCCRIDFSEDNTIFVGANNSGKTSAMAAIYKFFKRKDFSIDDFTISNFDDIDNIGKIYKGEGHVPNINEWRILCPSIDIWLDVKENELRYVSEIIPTLNWTGGLLGVRIIYEPKKVEELYRDYNKAQNFADAFVEKAKLWPQNMLEFLSKKMEMYFEFHEFILNIDNAHEIDDDSCCPQILSDDAVIIKNHVFDKLIKLDIIGAQRGLDDPKEEKSVSSGNSIISNQLGDYYDKQLDPEHEPKEKDLKVLEEIQSAKEVFDREIDAKFQNAIEELSKFGYPGNYNPKIKVTSGVQPRELIGHNTVIEYEVYNKRRLPEKYNGLGFQNLILIVLKLIGFRDQWINSKKKEGKEDDKIIQPIHLVLIEEPEAHLHVQVQKVFIENAYNILTNIDEEKKEFYKTQMIVSTHSSTIALESKFNNLRYFKRIRNKEGLSISVIENLSNLYKKEKDVTYFVEKYIRVTLCDLFFADAVIFIEGTERLFIRQFMSKYDTLKHSYISIIEVGGAYASKFFPLIKKLGIRALIITDLDSIKDKQNVLPERGCGYKTSNATIKNWFNNKDITIDDLFDMPEDKKIVKNNSLEENSVMRIAYQCPINIKIKDNDNEFIPRTFEDSILYTNYYLFKRLTGSGLIKKFKNALKEENVEDVKEQIWEALKDKNVDKTTFAFDLVYNLSEGEIQTPTYIEEGLVWLNNELKEIDNNEFFQRVN